MKRQNDLHDLLCAAAAMARAPAAYIALSERGGPVVAVTYGSLPESLPAAPAQGRALMQEVLSPLSALARAPWHYVFRISCPMVFAEGQGLATLYFLTRSTLDLESACLRDGLEALIRQMVKVLDRPLEPEDQRFAPGPAMPGTTQPDTRPRETGTLPSIDDLPGIGTFEIQLGSHVITLSSELVRLTGVATGTRCPIDVFAQSMPVPDADLLHFAEGSSAGILLQETDYLLECQSDQTRSWVRRRAEVETDEQGQPWRLIGTIEDITRDRVATNRLSAMVILGDALRKVDTLEEAYHAASCALGDALGTDRAGWAMIERGDETRFRIMEDWRAPSIPSAAGIYRRADYQVAFGVLDHGLLLAVRDAGENVWIACEAPARGEGDQIRAQLLMPIMAQGQMTHCLFVQSCVPRDWSDHELAFIRAVADRVQAAAASLEARAHQETLHQELAHRLKNTLALVQALANQSLRGVENRAAVKAFEKRLVALGSAHDLLMRQSWQRGDLGTLAREVLGRVGPIERFSLEGFTVSVGPNTATTLGLMLHELGTNAVKYGALSDEAGHVSLTWRVVQTDGRNMLCLHWLEEGGPPVTPPESRGFGSRLLQSGFGHQGSAVVSYPVTGCDARFTIPLSQAESN